MKKLLILLTFCSLTLCAYAKYGGGTGEPNTPYEISNVNDLFLLAEDTNDYDKCFILTNDINPAEFTFTTALIAPDTSSSSGFQGTAFTGTFDGNDHIIISLNIGKGKKKQGLPGLVRTSWTK